MNDFLYPGILSSIALLVYYFTLFKAGTARVKYNIQAPSHDGPEAVSYTHLTLPTNREV